MANVDKVNMIVAHGLDGAIGKNGELPWSGYNDLDWFRQMTMDDSMLFGRKTWENMPPITLDSREVFVLTTNSTRSSFNPNVNYIQSLSEIYTSNSRVWICGGASVYDLFLKDYTCDAVFRTVFNEKYEADTYIDNEYLDFKSDLTELVSWQPEDSKYPVGTVRQILT